MSAVLPILMQNYSGNDSVALDIAPTHHPSPGILVPTNNSLETTRHYTGLTKDVVLFVSFFSWGLGGDLSQELEFWVKL